MDINQLRQRVGALRQKTESGTYYEMLGVSEDASAADVKAAFREHAKLLHADRYASLDLGPLKQEMEKVLGILSKAHSTLSNDAERKDYDAKLKLEAAGVPTDLRVIFEADTKFKTGKRLLDRGNFASALEHFKDASDANPSEPDFQSYRWWAEYCNLDTDKKGRPKSETSIARIRQKLEQLSKQHEKYEMALVFLGHIARTNGSDDEAMRYYKRARAINPQNQEATSGLRLLKMREKKKSEGGFFARLFGR